MKSADKMDRRAFGAGLGTMLVALSAGAQTHDTGAAAEMMQEPGLVPAVPGPEGKGGKPHADMLPTLKSGTFSPGPGYGSLPKRKSHRYLMGMLTAGNIELEMHETIQEPHAEHEPMETHKHNEIWCVQRGLAALFINDVEHKMEPGDIGLVCAGDRHWIKNIGTGELAYFVITIGPPE